MQAHCGVHNIKLTQRKENPQFQSSHTVPDSGQVTHSGTYTCLKMGICSLTKERLLENKTTTKSVSVWRYLS